MVTLRGIYIGMLIVLGMRNVDERAPFADLMNNGDRNRAMSAKRKLQVATTKGSKRKLTSISCTQYPSLR